MAGNHTAPTYFFDPETGIQSSQNNLFGINTGGMNNPQNTPGSTGGRGRSPQPDLIPQQDASAGTQQRFGILRVNSEQEVETPRPIFYRSNSSDWKHSVPSSMPWGQPLGSHPPMFGALTGFRIPLSARSNRYPADKIPKKMKRKAQRTEVSHRRKEYVSEERMAAQLQAMSLENKNSENQDEQNSVWRSRLAGWEERNRQSDSTSSSDDESDELTRMTDDGDDIRLELGPVLQRELKKSATKMRRALLADFARQSAPCRELVLWQPKPDILKDAVSKNIESSRALSPDSSPRASSLHPLSSRSSPETSPPRRCSPLSLSNVSLDGDSDLNVDSGEMEL